MKALIVRYIAGLLPIIRDISGVNGGLNAQIRAITQG